MLHSLAVVRAAPNRGDKTAATSHKQNVVCNAQAGFASSGKDSIYFLCVIKAILENIFRLNDFKVFKFMLLLESYFRQRTLICFNTVLAACSLKKCQAAQKY